MSDKSTTTQNIVQGAELLVDVALPLPFLPPNVRLALLIAKAAIAAIERASNDGRDVTDEELDALFAEDEAARQADLAARQKRLGEPPV